MDTFKIGKKIMAAAVLAGIVITAAGCAGANGSTASKIDDPVDAREAALDYIRKAYPNKVPFDAVEWQQQDKAPSGIVGADGRYFVYDNWTADVTYPVVLPDLTVYNVTIIDAASGMRWTIKVDAGGKATESTPVQQMNEEAARELAGKFVKGEATFKFDGMDDTFKLVDTTTLRTPYAWLFTFRFDSRHAGYGDRTGQMVAQVITPHTAVITVIRGEVITAVMDEQWDMLKQQLVQADNGTMPPLNDGIDGKLLEINIDEFLSLKNIAREVEITCPGSLVVNLPANPSTGYSWEEAAISDNTVINQYSRQFVAGAQGVVGAPGKEVWTFKSEKQGKTVISFGYSRPWESKVEWFLKLTVIVK